MKYLLFGRRGVILSLAIILVLFGVIDIAGADNTTEHEVTVEVEDINEIALTGGNPSKITLKISTTTAGSELVSVTNEECTLSWTTNETNKKIVVASDSYSGFTLTVQATSIYKNGDSVGDGAVIDLSAGGDLYDIANSYGYCTLKYTLSATAA